MDIWDQAELLRLMDLEHSGPGTFVAPAHGPTARNVVEAGQLLADAVVAASKEIPDQRVLSASMIFSRIARHDAPLDIELQIPHRGRRYATVEARLLQAGRQSCSGLLLLGSEPDALLSASAPPPAVPGPDEVPLFDRPEMQVGGRELRIVDDGYTLDPEHVGPPEMHVWTRFAEPVSPPYLNTALLTQSVTHWTIAAALRPHAGYTETMAHDVITTGINKATVAYHDEVDVSRWMLYSTQVVYTGRGMTQSEGRVYDEDGRVLATCAVQGMIRPLESTGAGADTLL